MAQFIVTRPIIYLCLQAEWGPGARVGKWSWDQEGIDLAVVLEETEVGRPEESEESDDNEMG